MLSIRPRFFFEYPYLDFCLWSCISVPGFFQRSQSECCWHILVCRFSIITLVFDTFIFRFSRSSVNSCSICCSSCGVLGQLEAKMTKIIAVYLQEQPLGSQVSHRNMLSSAAVNSLGDMVSLCRTPLFMLILLLSLCRWTLTQLLV